MEYESSKLHERAVISREESSEGPERAVDHEKAPDVSERAVTRERAPESQERAEMSQPDTPRAPYYKSGKPKTCSLCGEPCQSWERNTDGTYTHAACLRPHLIYPLTRSV